MGDEKPNSEEFYHEFLKKYDTISSPTELIKSKIFNTMRVITDVHSYKTANLIINYFVFTIQTIQLFCITMFPGDYGIWSIDSEFSRVGTIFSIFLRIIPFDCSFDQHCATIVFILFVNALIAVFFLLVYTYYKPYSPFTYSTLKWIPLLPLNISRIMVAPVISHLIYIIMNITVDRIGYLIIAILNVIASLICYTLNCIFSGSFPSFSPRFNSRWISFPYSPNLFYIALAAGLCESLSYISNDIGRLVIMIIVTVAALIRVIYCIVACPFIKLSSNIFFVAMNLIFFSNGITITIIQKMKTGSPYWVLIFCISIMPAFLISNIIVKRRLICLRSINERCISEKDFSYLENLQKQIATTAVCSSFNGDFSSLNWLYEHYKDDFQIVYLYSKFTVLFKERHKNLKQIVLHLKSFTNPNFYNKLCLCYLEMLYFMNCADPDEASEQSRSAVDDYLMTLNLFWTEILIGRKQRLISLSHVVNEKYLYCKALFRIFGNSLNKLENYKRFTSVSSIYLESVIPTEPQTLMTTIYLESKNNIPIISPDILFTPQQPNVTTSRSIPIEQVANDIKRKIYFLRLFILYYPYIFIFLVWILMILFFSKEQRNVHEIWSTEKYLLDSIYPIATSFFIQPLFPLFSYNILNNQNIQKFLENDILFLTKLTDIKTDMIYLMNMTLDAYPFLTMYIQNHPYPQTLQFILSHDYELFLYPDTSNDSRNLSFYMLIEVLSYYSSTFVLDKSKENFVEMYATNFSRYFTRNNLLMFNAVLTFLVNYPTLNNNVLQTHFKKTSFNFEIIASILLFLALVTQILSSFLMNYFICNFFDNLFAMPKVSITSLITKFGSLIWTDFIWSDNMESNLKYNMTQLSYQSAPKSYKYNIFNVYSFAICSFIIIIIFRCLYASTTFYSKTFLDNSIQNLINSSTVLSLPIYLSYVQHDALELLLIEELKLNPTDNYRANLYNNIFDTTTFIINDLYPFISNPNNFPQYLYSLFFMSSNNLTSDSIASQSITQILAFLVTTNLAFLHEVDNKKITDETIVTMTGASVSLFSKIVPFLMNHLYENNEENLERYSFISSIIIFVFIFALFVTLIFTHMVFGTSVNDPNFMISFLSTLPETVLASFKKGKTSFSTEGQVSLSSIFEKEDILQNIMIPIVLCDSMNNLIFINPNGLITLQIDELLTRFQDLLKKIKFPTQNLKFPPTEPTRLFEYCTLQSGEQKPIALYMTPVKKFSYAGHAVEYICTLQDRTQVENAINTMNIEANKIRILINQFVPYSIAESIVNSKDIRNLSLSTILCVNIFLRTQIPFTSNELSSIQVILNQLMREYPFFFFSCRSLQFFRILSSLNNSNIPLTEQASSAIYFSMKLINQIKVLSESINKQIDVHCGIHAPSILFSDLINDLPPIYDVFGSDISISEIIAMKCNVNKINITRDVCELIFGQTNFEIAFETEISLLNGQVIPVHVVTQQILE